MLISKAVYFSLAALAYIGGLDLSSETHRDLVFYSMSLIAGLEVGHVIRVAREITPSRKRKPIFTIESVPAFETVIAQPRVALDWICSVSKPMPTACPACPACPAPFPTDISPAFIYFAPATCAADERPSFIPASSPAPAVIPQVCRFDWTGTLAKSMPNTCPAGPAPISTSPFWMLPSLSNVFSICTTFERPDLTPVQVQMTQNSISCRPTLSVAIFPSQIPTSVIRFPAIRFPILDLRAFLTALAIALVITWVVLLWAYDELVLPDIWLPTVQHLAYSTYDGEFLIEPTFDSVVFNALDMTLETHRDAERRGSNGPNAIAVDLPEIIIPGIENLSAIAAESEADDTRALLTLWPSTADVLLCDASDVQRFWFEPIMDWFDDNPHWVAACDSPDEETIVVLIERVADSVLLIQLAICSMMCENLRAVEVSSS
ncbi:hypothetical protein C0995_006459 [Termitomyces sp. Mi166|nr:hypothetical protein C0995_006459 [Termitomyces sp. Mi166\